ncbi:MAG: hypothetical protein KAT15_16705, partial [Bacteroidales bacterium]|nr:hypothetical protein [Bacteroidales bacterium]
DKFQRAYILEGTKDGSPVELQLDGSKEHPVVNPAFVLKGWGEMPVSITTGGVDAKEGTDFRTGYEKKPEGTDLVIWIEEQSQENKQYTIQ